MKGIEADADSGFAVWTLLTHVVGFDPLIDRERLYARCIIDDYHAVEHLYEAARAARGKGSPEATAFAEELKPPSSEAA